MILIVLGILLLIVSFSLPANPNLRPTVRIGRLLSIGFIILGIVTSCFIQIDAGQIGVKKLFGNVQRDVLTSGLHFINPLLEVQRMDARTQNYTMSGVHDEGQKTGDDAIRVLSADGLEVTIDLTVLYRLVPGDAPRLVRETGIDYEDKIVRPIARTRIRDNAVYYDAVALYSTKRDEFQTRIFSGIENDFKKARLTAGKFIGAEYYPSGYGKSLYRAKIQAEQEAQKMQFILQKERQEADRKRVEAQGIADYQRIISESLTDKQLQYEQIKAMVTLAQSQNSKIIMMGGKNAPVILNGKD